VQRVEDGEVAAAGETETDLDTAPDQCPPDRFGDPHLGNLHPSPLFIPLETNSFRDGADRGSYRRPRGRASQLTRLVWLLRGPYEDLVYANPFRLGNDVDDGVGDVLGLEGVELLEQGA
jgi:hypothetical protein